VNAKIFKDIPYRVDQGGVEDPHPDCRLDLYLPENTKKFPSVVWFHGGGLKRGNRSIPEKLKARGLAVAGVGYRFSPGVRSPAHVEDAAAAVAWIFRNIENYGGNVEEIFLSGHSAGAYLVLMLALDTRYLRHHGVEANQVAGFIPISGHAITHHTIREERGMDEKQPVIDDMAPLFHVRGDSPPILLVTGDREQELLGRYEENAYLWRMMKICGSEAVTLRELTGFNHGTVVEPGLDLLVDFVRNHLEVGPASVLNNPRGSALVC
jgi:acetyl esterase/lipase